MNPLETPVQFVRGVGPQRGEALAKQGVRTALDLLLHAPLRYEDRRAFAKVGELRAGMKVAVAGTIAVAGARRARRVSIYEIRLGDGSGYLKAIWFNQPYLKEALPKGARVVLFGEVEPDEFGGRGVVMTSPQYEKVEEGDAGIHTGRIVAVHERLGALTAKPLRRILTGLAESLPDDLPDPLPEDVRRALGVIPLAPALRGLHDPPPDADLAQLNAARSPAHVRLILEELFLFQAGLAQQRERRRAGHKVARFEIGDAQRQAVKRVLPFRLTEAQKRTLREIVDDLRSPHPMHRLVQGDVGSGKTVVALLAMVVAAECGAQAAFMAPTEILAEQHYLTFKRVLAKAPYGVELLTASVKGKARKAVLARLASGESAFAVGTHALIQGDVAFRSLGLAVVDEQHRFGVLQREELRRKGHDVDLLVMTATPIPRTLALTAYGDLDVSVIDERPPGRTPIRTLWKPATERRAVLEHVRAELRQGRQAYVVYPLVEESEKLEDVKAATAMAEQWKAALPGVRVELLHGRMKGEEKEAVMAAFSSGQAAVLVATTVIEVGVDVPNATLMVIEHAERFGLAQLHQLRGRVGRGAGASTCILLSHGATSEEARSRLQVLVDTDDGFRIAERDLELRGPGDFFGTRQSGLPRFRVAELLRDRPLLEQARREAFALCARCRGGALPQPLPHYLEGGAWEARFGLSRIG